MQQKLLLISTIGPEHPEKATLPFVIATAAQALDVKVVMFLQSNGVILAKKGEAETIAAPGLVPMKELLDTFLEMGGTLMLCSPCLKERYITPNDLIEGAEIGAAGTLVSEIMSATSVVTY
uniref:Uncharacterized protein n=1 Tax=Chlorobium chlorochromatii (strain CaD3) TaxID=340177 RepID=Q3AR97_CHLCH